MKWVLSIAVLPCLCGQPSLRMERPIWAGQQQQSPNIPDNKFGLDFATVAATNAQGEAIALMAELRVPNRYAAIYGGRIAGAMLVVAIDALTGTVFHSPAERSGANPLAFAMNANPDAAALSGAPSDMATWVNLDLRNHLHLPAARADYFVFLWLDEFTSPVKRVSMPGPVRAPLAANVPILEAGWSRISSENRLRLSQLPGGSIQGTLAREAKTAPLVLLALDFQKRAVSAAKIAAPQASNREFEFDPARLAGPLDPKHRYYFLASHGAELSNVLAFRYGMPQSH